MSPVGIETLPEEIRSRVLASSGNATYRRIEASQGSQEGRPIYAIEAVSGDRVTLSRLSLRSDGSVEEKTDSFGVGDIADVVVDDAGADLQVRGPARTRVVHIAPETLEAVRAVSTLD